MNKSQERTKHSTQSNNKLKCVSMKSFNWKRDKRHIVRFYDEVRDAFVSSLWMIKLWQFFLLRLRLLVISFLVSIFFLSSFCFYLTLFARLEMSMSIRVTPILTRHAKTKTEEQKLISSRDAQMLNLPYRSVNSNIVNIESNGHDKKIDLFEPKKKKTNPKEEKWEIKNRLNSFGQFDIEMIFSITHGRRQPNAKFDKPTNSCTSSTATVFWLPVILPKITDWNEIFWKIKKKATKIVNKNETKRNEKTKKIWYFVTCHEYRCVFVHILNNSRHHLQIVRLHVTRNKCNQFLTEAKQSTSDEEEENIVQSKSRNSILCLFVCFCEYWRSKTKKRQRQTKKKPKQRLCEWKWNK